jgi:hypothetical protein
MQPVETALAMQYVEKIAKRAQKTVSAKPDNPAQTANVLPQIVVETVRVKPCEAKTA